MKRFKVTSLVLVMFLIVTTFTSVFATPIDIDLNSTKAMITEEHSDKLVSVIIELDDSTMLDFAISNSMTMEECNIDNKAINYRQQMIDNQINVQSIISKTVNSDVEYKYHYTNLLNGFAATVKESDIDTIEKLPNVKKVYLDQVYNLPTPQMESAGDICLIQEMWNSNYRGEGMVVAVLDTGFDVNHENMVLTDENKVAISKDKVNDIISCAKSGMIHLNALERKTKDADEYTVDDLYKNTKFPFTFDYADSDFNASVGQDPNISPGASEHGVHVAGIVASNDKDTHNKIIGTAPEAQIIGLKVFSDFTSGAASTDTIAAMEDAIVLGANVMNLSLGAPAGYTNTSTHGIISYGAISEKAKAAGIILMMSAGNSNKVGEGSAPQFQTYPLTTNPDTALVGCPSTSYEATSVASYENTMQTSPYIESKSLDFKFRYMDINEKDTTKGNRDIIFVDTLDGQTLEYEVCGQGRIGTFNEKDKDGNDIEVQYNDFEGKDLTNKIALISRGSISFQDKISNASSCGAIGVIVYNNRVDSNLFLMSGAEKCDIPSAFIYMEDGLKLTKATTKELYISKNNIGALPNLSKGLMSSFSSWGVTPDLHLKPEITAPGGKIYSCKTGNQYQDMSGTSMASPYAAGCAALVMQYINEKFENIDSEIKVHLVENLLMSSATVAINPDNDLPYSPRKQGAGLINLYNALHSDIVLKNADTGKAKVELLDNIGENYTISFDITNFSDQTRTYKLKGSALTDDFLGAGNGVYVIDEQATALDASMTYQNEPLSVYTMDENYKVSVSSGSAILTVGPNQTITANIDVSLNEKETKWLTDNIFPNGFFVEGFVELIAQEDGEPDLSIPYVGFYGDWGQPPIFDSSYLYDGFSYYDTFDKIAGNYFTNLNVGNLMQSLSGYGILGLFEGWASKNFIVANPQGINRDVFASVYLLRNIGEYDISIFNKDGNYIKTLDSGFGSYKSTYDGRYATVVPDMLYKYGTWDLTDKDGNTVEDGQYYYVYSAKVDFESADYQQLVYPVYVDSQKSAIKNLEVKLNTTDNKKYLEFDIEDNYMVGYVNIFDGKTIEDGEQPIQKIDFDPNGEVETRHIAIERGELENIVIQCTDLGYNVTEKVVNIKELEPNELIVIPGGNTGDTGNTGNTGDTGNTEDTGNCNDKVQEVIVSNTIINDIDENENTLEVNIDKNTNAEELVVNVPRAIVKKLNEKETKLIVKYDNNATFSIKPKTNDALTIRLSAASSIDAPEMYTPTSLNYNIEVLQNKKPVENVKVSLPVNDLANAERLMAYTMEDEVIVPIMTTLKDNMITFKLNNAKNYYIMSIEKTFEDISEHWAKTEIENMAAKNITNGKPGNIFDPDDKVTKAQFITMVVRALSLSGEKECTFENLSGEEWYANDLELAKEAGLIEGKVYNADNIISRVEMAQIISKAYAILNDVEFGFTGEIDLTDIDLNANYAKFIGFAVEKGLITGFPGKEFRPAENTTRAQAMVVLHRLINSR